MSRRSFTLLAASNLAMPAFAATEPRWYNNGSDLAASGRDVVAYFSLVHEDDFGIVGTPEYQTTYKEADFQFSSAGNLAKFESYPEKYAPRFGGYCAFAMSLNAFANADPDAWTVADGALYLNYSRVVRSRWREDILGNAKAGENNWAGYFPGER
jgi:YHS domain-containing protein